MSGSRNDLVGLGTFIRRRRPRAGLAPSSPYSTASSRICASRSRIMLMLRREVRGFELAAERVDAMDVEIGGRLVREEAEHVVQAPAVVQARLRRELRVPALPPARGRDVHGFVVLDGGRGFVCSARRLPGAALDLLQ